MGSVHDEVECRESNWNFITRDESHVGFLSWFYHYYHFTTYEGTSGRKWKLLQIFIHKNLLQNKEIFTHT